MESSGWEPLLEADEMLTTERDGRGQEPDQLEMV